MNEKRAARLYMSLSCVCILCAVWSCSTGYTPAEYADRRGVVLDKYSAQLSSAGNTVTLNPIQFPSSHAGNGNLSWYSSHGNVASVSREGVVTALTPGTTVITVVTQQNESADCLVTVGNAVKNAVSISLNVASQTIIEGEQFAVRPMFTPADTTDQSVVWTSSDTAVATVNAYGIVTGKSVGRANITAHSKADGTLSASCQVYVDLVK